MSRLIKILFWLLVSANSCCRLTDIYSSFALERNELLNRMRIIALITDNQSIGTIFISRISLSS